MYGRLINGVVEWHDGKTIELDNGVIVNPSLEELNNHGIYEVDTVAEDGENHIENGVIKNYIGAPVIYEHVASEETPEEHE